mmetsp:Transcript_92903/g.262360  ORF Transcript_92903/g.262360 Transcript_92903/m.262360 type:complete len:343 (-) Transcript_92903:334-1362(-)
MALHCGLAPICAAPLRHHLRRPRGCGLVASGPGGRTLAPLGLRRGGAAYRARDAEPGSTTSRAVHRCPAGVLVMFDLSRRHQDATPQKGFVVCAVASLHIAGGGRCPSRSLQLEACVLGILRVLLLRQVASLHITPCAIGGCLGTPLIHGLGTGLLGLPIVVVSCKRALLKDLLRSLGHCLLARPLHDACLRCALRLLAGLVDRGIGSLLPSLLVTLGRFSATLRQLRPKDGQPCCGRLRTRSRLVLVLLLLVLKCREAVRNLHATLGNAAPARGLAPRTFALRNLSPWLSGNGHLFRTRAWPSQDIVRRGARAAESAPDREWLKRLPLAAPPRAAFQVVNA